MNSEHYRDPTAAKAIARVEKQMQGRRNRITGEYFENMIAASLRWYEDRGIACIEKTPEPMKPLGRPNHKGQFPACFVKSAQPDFKGTINGGRSVVFEAKHTDSDRIEYNRLTEEQITRLSTHYRLGAVTFVLVSFDLQRFYRVPWSIWMNMKAAYGCKYIKESELSQYRVEYKSGVIKLLGPTPAEKDITKGATNK